MIFGDGQSRPMTGTCRGGPVAWLSLVGALFLAGDGKGLAQDRNADPPPGLQQQRPAPVAFPNWIQPRLDAVLLHASAGIVQRYGLRETVSPRLFQALRKATETAVFDADKMREIRDQARVGNNGRLWLSILSLSACREVLGEHLDREKVEDYVAFTRRRAERETEAVAGQLAAWADRFLSLTPDQRRKVGEALASGPGKEWLSSQALLRLSARGFTNFLTRLRTDTATLEGMLSPSQVRVWQLLSSETGEYRGRRIDGARLAAHTDLLGELDHRTAGRLALAAKGVVQLSLEGTGGPYDRSRAEREAGFLRTTTEIWGDVIDGQLTRRQAAESLQAARQLLAEATDDTGGSGATLDIADHPLYQETIRNALSESAYQRYRGIHAERISSWEEATRALALACLDTRLLLSEGRRQRAERIAARLPVDADLPAGVVFAEVLAKLDEVDWNDWERETLEHIRQDLGW